MPRLHSGAATDRPEIIHLILPRIPGVVWQQPQATHVTNIHLVWTNETHRKTRIPETKQRNDVESQTSPMKESSSQVSGSSTEPHLGKSNWEHAKTERKWHQETYIWNPMTWTEH